MYSNGIQLVFCQNTNVGVLLLPTYQRTVGTTHWAVPTADSPVTNVGSMYVQGATYTLQPSDYKRVNCKNVGM